MTKLFGKENGMFGKKHSNSTRGKISIALTGRKLTEEQKIKIGGYSRGKTYEELYGVEKAKELKELRAIQRRGKKMSQESKDKLSNSRKGCVISKETRKKWSLSKKGKMPKHKSGCICSVCRIVRGEPPYNKGKTYEELFGEDRAKEMKEHQSRTRKGVPHPNVNLSGANNPAWKGGISFEPYGIAFNDKCKEQIRIRDNSVCQICKAPENGRKLSVHHIDYNKQNNDPLNLIAVCEICHGFTGENRIVFQEALEEYQQNRFGDKK